MKLVKIFGAVMAVHAAVFMFVFAIPGCRSTGKKPAATAATVPTGEGDLSPVSSSNPVSAGEPATVAPIRFSPTRPGTPAAEEVTTAQSEAAAASTYTVVKGDSLWSIAKKNGVSVKQLTAANNLRADSTLKLGQKLAIPGKASATPSTVRTTTSTSATAPAAAPASTGTSGAALTHVVKSGETLGSIAKKYQVKAGDIATANNIADPTKIRVDQKLKIPGWQAPASKSSSTATASKPAPAITTPAPATAPAATTPATPVFTSPFETSPVAPAESSPFITPPPAQDAPLIRVEESGAPRIE